MFASLKRLYSRTFRSLPVVSIDTPHRVEPGQPVPVVCRITKPADKSVSIESVEMNISLDGTSVQSSVPLKSAVELQKPLWQSVFTVPLPNNVTGRLTVDVVVKLKIDGKKKTVRNGRAGSSSDKPFVVYRPEEPLPLFDNFIYGDLHFYHYISNHGIYSAPSLADSASFAKAMGLKFITAADSPNFDAGIPDNGAGNNGNDRNRFINELDTWNNSNDLFILTGEEVTCRNERNRDIDIMIINNPDPVSASNSKVSNGSKSRSVSNVKQIVEKVSSKALTFAIQPARKSTVIGKFFSKKGFWGKADLSLKGLTGIHIENTERNGSTNPGLKNWINILLSGQKKFISAGCCSDPSAAINKNGRTVNGKNDSIPELSDIRTGIVCENPQGTDSVVDSLRNGRSVITNGPLMDFSVSNESGGRSPLGGEISGSAFTVRFRSVSSREYGPITKIKIFSGDKASGIEEPIYTVHYKGDLFSVQGEFHVDPRSDFGYLRGELYSGSSNQKGFCYTNPVWIVSAGNRTLH